MGDFVEIGDSVADVAWAVVQRLLTARWRAADPGRRSRRATTGLPERLADRVRASWPGVDVEVVDGGQPRYPLLLGLE